MAHGTSPLKPLDNDSLNDLFTDIKNNALKEKRDILVIEDNELDSSQIVKMLRDETMSIDIASTAQQGLEFIEAKDFDCIILDYTLPRSFRGRAYCQDLEGQEEADTGYYLLGA